MIPSIGGPQNCEGRSLAHTPGFSCSQKGCQAKGQVLVPGGHWEKVKMEFSPCKRDLMCNTWPCKSGFGVQHGPAKGSSMALQKGPGFLDFWPCQIGFGPNAQTSSLKKKVHLFLWQLWFSSRFPQKNAHIVFQKNFCLELENWYPSYCIIWHHMMGGHHMMGKSHHMMGKSHHMMGKSHHMMGKSHHMMGGAIILHHVMQYDGSSFFRVHDCFCLQPFCNQTFWPSCPAQGKFPKKSGSFQKKIVAKWERQWKPWKPLQAKFWPWRQKVKQKQKKLLQKGQALRKGKVLQKGQPWGSQPVHLHCPRMKGSVLKKKWKSFTKRAARMSMVFWVHWKSLKDPQCDKMWNEHCKGKGSESKKKQLLEVFLKSKGDLKKNNLFHKELLSISGVHGNLAESCPWSSTCMICGATSFPGNKESEEWVPFATILQRFGLREAMRRASWHHFMCWVIYCSSALALWAKPGFKEAQSRSGRTPRGPEEWQLKLEKEVSYTDRKQSHEMNMEASNKLEAVEWMKAIKLGSFLGGQDQLAGEEALPDVLTDKEKRDKNVSWPWQTKRKRKMKVIKKIKQSRMVPAAKASAEDGEAPQRAHQPKL